MEVNSSEAMFTFKLLYFLEVPPTRVSWPFERHPTPSFKDLSRKTFGLFEHLHGFLSSFLESSFKGFTMSVNVHVLPWCVVGARQTDPAISPGAQFNLLKQVINMFGICEIDGVSRQSDALNSNGCTHMSQSRIT